MDEPRDRTEQNLRADAYAGRHAEGGAVRGGPPLGGVDRPRPSSLSPPTYDEPPFRNPMMWVVLGALGVVLALFGGAGFFILGWAVGAIALLVGFVVLVFWAVAKALMATQRERPRTVLGHTVEPEDRPRL